MLAPQTEETVIKDDEIEEQLEPTDLEVAVDEPERIVPAIEFRDVHLSFDDKKILEGINFTVRRGETKIILGRSGGGKSTTIRLILGLLKPDSGQIFIDGEDITQYTEVEMMEVRKKIGMVFQEGALFDSLSVYDNVAYRLHEQGVAEEAQAAQAEVIKIRSMNELAVRRILTAEQITKFRVFREQFMQKMNDRKNQKRNSRLKNFPNRPFGSPNKRFDKRQNLPRSTN